MNNFSENENFLLNLLDLTNDNICIKDLEHKILYANESYIKFLGKNSIDEVLDKTTYDFLPDEFAKKNFEQEKLTLKGESLENLEQKYLNDMNEICYISTKLRPMYGDSNNIIGFIEISHDITEKKICESRIKEFADYDSLTGLYNKKMFIAQASSHLKICKRECEEALVYFVELNAFKDIKEEFGEEISNRVLKVIAQRLKKAFRTSDLISRYSEDEFVIFSISNDEKKALQCMKEYIIKSISKEIVMNEQKISIDCNIGSASYPNSSRELEKLILLASEDMYRL